MTIKIQAFKISQFTKNGRLKKNAKNCYSATLVLKNDTNIDKELGEIAIELNKLGFTEFSSPYIFTHIKARKDNEQIVIYEHVVLDNGQEVITSPTKLLNQLTQVFPTLNSFEEVII